MNLRKLNKISSGKNILLFFLFSVLFFKKSDGIIVFPFAKNKAAFVTYLQQQIDKISLSCKNVPYFSERLLEMYISVFCDKKPNQFDFGIFGFFL